MALELSNEDRLGQMRGAGQEKAVLLCTGRFWRWGDTDKVRDFLEISKEVVMRELGQAWTAEGWEKYWKLEPRPSLLSRSVSRF